MSYRDNRKKRPRDSSGRYRGERSDNRFRQGRRPQRFEREEHARTGKPIPKPVGDMCNPLCPYFRCSKKALLITTEHYRGQPIKEAYCRWIGDKCIGAQCQYAYCALQKMLPDGRCGWALERKQQKKREFEEELETDDLGLRSKSLLSKLGFKEDEF